MEAGIVDGNETKSAAASSAKHKDLSNTNREIDQQKLAALLRESANLVEKGEFGSILYEALQDFRAYYKQKYPKTGKKKKTKPKSKSPRRASADTGTAPEKVAHTTTGILEDLKESEDKPDLSTAREESKKEPDGETGFTEQISERSDYSKPPSGRSLESSGDVPVKADSDPNVNSNIDVQVRSESAHANSEEISAPSAVDQTTNNDDAEESTPVETPVLTADVSAAPGTPMQVPQKSVESAIPMHQQSDAPDHSNTATPNTTRSSFMTPVTPQTTNRGFGKKFKLGATLQNVKKSALNVKKAAKNVTEKFHENIDRHHHQNHRKTPSGNRDDIQFFAETGVDMAESSGRRTFANMDTTGKEFGTNSGFQSRMTPGMAGASGAGTGSPSSEQEQNSEYSAENNDKQNNQASRDNHGQADSDPNISRPSSDRNVYTSATNQGGPPILGSKPYGQQQQQQQTSECEDSYDSGGERITVNSEPSFDEADPIMECDAKPKFQRPANSSSPLVVSGWIEQFRRSKMRHVWKEVLASLVEGRKPGEVTTLWIQREITNPSTGHKELEALHRIPLKMLEEVTFAEQTTDNQFRIKLYNATEDFVFRCEDAPNDTLRWVQTLKKHEQLAKRTTDSGENEAHTESSNPFQQQQVSSTKGMAIRDLRATCHGAGINTAGMERAELEAAAEEVRQRGTYFNQQGKPTGASIAHAHRYHNDPNTQQYAPPQQQQQYSPTNHANVDSNQSSNAMPAPAESAPPQQEQQQPQQRVGIKELRAICHGAGINTAGMERRELEAAAKEVQSRGTYFNPPIGTHAANDDNARARQEELKRQQQQQQRNEELRRRQEVEERHRREVEEARRRAAVAEEEKRRRAAEEEARRRAVEDEARRRAAAEEQLRRQREAQAAQTRYAQQQAAWQNQQQADEQRRRMAEQQAAAERRRREEELRKAREWAVPAPGARPQQQQPHQYHQQQRQQAYPQQQWQRQQQQPPPQHRQQHQPRNQNPPPPQQYHQQQPQNHAPPPPQQQRQHSGTDNKYAKMANQSDDDGQAAITKIKHSILIQWALQPPQLRMLRPIAALVTTIHTVFPPALGVSAHDYFTKWKPITREDVAGANGLPEEAKLKKSVRKIRFFLHPDKLPHDLDEEQKFMVKMLWDITSDAWEEYQKNKEELDWVN